jgi:hypothetical protein
MAKLKILTGTGGPDAAGYLKVVNRFLERDANGDPSFLIRFVAEANADCRASMLQGLLHDHPNKIRQATHDPLQDHEPGDVISDANCKIHAQEDGRRRNGNEIRHRSKVVVPVPHRNFAPNPANTSFDYLAHYVQAIVSEYGDGRDQTRVINACKLLFGFMMLTRCR